METLGVIPMIESAASSDGSGVDSVLSSAESCDDIGGDCDCDCHDCVASDVS